MQDVNFSGMQKPSTISGGKVNKKLFVASVVWASIATGLLLWGIFGTAPWEHSRLCQDALMRRREVITLRKGPASTTLNTYLSEAENDIAKWCR